MERNRAIDQIRGFAAVIVVVGHVFQLFDNYSTSPIFNIIFSIQMPLFMAVSGYTTIYSKTIDNISAVVIHIKKRMVSILLPWFMWSMLVFIFKGQLPFIQYVKFVAYHMESAYWFLFSLWCIDFMFVWSSFFANKIVKNHAWLVEICISFVFVILLLALGSKVGLTFLGIKYTAYYYLYYLLGRVVALIDSNDNFRKIHCIIDIVMTVFLGVYVLLITKYNVYVMEDNLFNIAIRFVISSSICVFIFYFFSHVNSSVNSVVQKILELAGKFSLELYVVQIFTLKIIPINGIELCSIEGYLYCLADSLFVFAFSIIMIKLININPITRFLLFGKKYEKA